MAECGAETDRGRPSVHCPPVSIELRVVDGPVTPVDEAYAREQAAYLRRHSPWAIHCCRVHLCLSVDDHGASIAVVDGFLIMGDDRMVCAGAVAGTMRAAINQLVSRLRCHVFGQQQRERSPHSRWRGAAEAVSR